MEFVSSVLERIAKKEGFIKFTIKPPSEKIPTNTHLMSTFDQVIIDGEKQTAESDGTIEHATLVLIVKTLASNQKIVDFFDVKNLFEREIHFYMNILPKIPDFLRKHKSVPFDKSEYYFIPKAYDGYHCNERNEYILVLEDLKQKGFAMKMGTLFLDSAHVKLVLNNMAKFHAISFAMRDQNIDLFNELKDGVPDIYVPHRLNYIPSYEVYETGIEYMEKALNETDVVEAEKVRDLLSNFRKSFQDSIDPEACESYGVIGHGDCYTLNYMFRYDPNSNEPNAVQFLDWQLCRYGSVAHDLIHFLFISISREARAEHYDEYLQYYYDVLCNEIRTFGSDPQKLFPYTAYQQQLQRFGKFALIIAPSFYIIFASWTELSNNSSSKQILMDSWFGRHSKEFFKTYSNQTFKYLMRELVMDAVKYGYL